MAAKAKKTGSAGTRRYWLLKSEPETFGWDALLKAPDRTTCWDGVRNYQARNTLRDDMKQGDLAFLYHSSTDVPAIVGIVEITRGGYPDHTQFDPKHDHYDAGAKQDDPRWFMVDVRAVEALPRPVPLTELRTQKALAKMVLLQRGSRLSVQPVTAPEWDAIMKLSKKA